MFAFGAQKHISIEYLLLHIFSGRSRIGPGCNARFIFLFLIKEIISESVVVVVVVVDFHFTEFDRTNM